MCVVDKAFFQNHKRNEAAFLL